MYKNNIIINRQDTPLTNNIDQSKDAIVIVTHLDSAILFWGREGGRERERERSKLITCYHFVNQTSTHTCTLVIKQITI